MGKATPRNPLCAWCIALFLGAAGAGACGGSVNEAPSIGSESHFLAYCTARCEGGLDCIAGICTRSCLTQEASCGDLAAGAACTNQSVEPGQVAVCDVSCASGAECGTLGSGYRCEGGFCRSGSSAGVVDAAGAGAGAAPDEAVCEAFRDQSPPPDVRAISIVNTGSVPLYIVPVTDCQTRPSLLSVEREGPFIDLTPMYLRCGHPCQQLIEEGWHYPPGEEASPLCSVDCGLPPLVEIGPGQTLLQPVTREVVQKQLPRACAQGAPLETVTCESLVIPPPGNYTLTVRTVVNPTCDSGVDCACHPDATGTCTNNNLRATNSSTPLIFSFPSSGYFQNQTLSISASGN